MALRDLLVFLDQSEQAIDRLRLAGTLAHRHKSRLTGLYVRELTPAQLQEISIAELGQGSAQSIERIDQGIEQSIGDTARRLRGALTLMEHDLGIEVEWRQLSGRSANLVPQHARFADLCILTQDTPNTMAATGYTFSEQVLFETGRPVLIVPARGNFIHIGAHIVVAWNSSRASTRALNDALPLLERADRVTVLAINPVQFVKRYGALPPERIVEHLRRHGAAVEGLWLSNVPTAAIAGTLQSEARRLGADLVVAGAFGHPKLWEQLMGGVTRDLLTHMELPVLMSL